MIWIGYSIGSPDIPSLCAIVIIGSIIPVYFIMHVLHIKQLFPKMEIRFSYNEKPP